MGTDKQEADLLLNYFQRGTTVSIKKGDMVLRAGDAPTGINLITNGFVKVYSTTAGGDENLHIIYKAGELFPVLWAINDTLRDVNFQAMTPVVVQRLARDEFHHLITTDVAACHAVLLQVARQFGLYTERVDNLEHINAYQRVAYRLLFLGRRFGVPSGDGVIIDIPLTHQSIASSIRLSRETASREIEKLMYAGFISYRQRRFIINDTGRLEDEAGGVI